VILTVKGLPEAEESFRRIVRGINTMAHTTAQIGTRLPYGYGQEYGRARLSGRLARKDGGVYFLNRALTEVLMDADRDLAEGLNRVTAPGAWVIVRLARWVRRLARSYAPVGTAAEGDKHPGKLRRSIHIERGARA
jgi:hypothetical protein